MVVHLLGENCYWPSGSDENCTLSALTSYKSKIGDTSVDIAICYRFVPLPQFLVLLQTL